MKTFGVGVIAGLNFLEGLLLFALTWGYAQWLVAVKELEGLGEKLRPEEADIFYLPFRLQQSLGERTMLAGLILLCGLLIVSGIGLLSRRNWARRITLTITPFRPMLVFKISQALSEKTIDATSIGMILPFVIILVWIVWYLFQTEVKQEFGITD